MRVKKNQSAQSVKKVSPKTTGHTSSQRLLAQGIAKRLRVVREVFNWTQEDAAREFGVSLRAWLEYEGGRSVPKAQTIADLGNRGIMPLWLLTGEGPMRPDQTIEVSKDEFSYVPLIAAEVAAGQGREVYSEQAIAMLAFRKDWLNTELRVKAGNLAAMTVQGESMEPTFSDGDVVLVDRSATDPAREGVYVLRMDNGLLVKRLQLLPDGQVEARSDHQAYKPFTFDWPAPPHRLAIIGRVVWVGHKL